MSALDAMSRVVVFRVERALYGIDVQMVERVVRHTTPRHVPRLPAWIQGVTDFDGRLVPVIDVRDRLATTPQPTGILTRMLLLSLDGEWCGLVVDQVLDVRVYSTGEVVAPPTLVRHLGGGLVTGALTRGDETILLVDPRQLFGAEERTLLATVGAPHG